MARHVASEHTLRRVLGFGILAVLLIGAVAAVSLELTGPGQGTASTPEPSAPQSVEPPSDCAATPAVRIVAASGIAPVVAELAGDVCAEVTVAVNDDSTAAAAFAAGEADVWVPDSSVRAVLAGREAASAAVSLATSPIVMATSPDLDTSAFAPGGSTSWGILLQREELKPASVEIADPAASSTSLVVAAALRDLAVQATQDKYLGLAATAVALTDLPAAGDGSIEGGAIRVTEARLLPAEGASVLTMAEGNPFLDYPWVASPALAGTPEGDAAEEILAAFQKPAGSDALQRQGMFDAGVSTYDLSDDQSAATALIDVPRWRAIPSLYALAEGGGLRGNSLAVLDVSGSMAVPASPGAPTPMQGVKSSAALATQFLSDETSLGLWQFGYQLSTTDDHVELVALAPLSKNRTKVQRAIAKARPLDTGTSLYRTVLEANRHMQTNWKANRSNIIAVFTDGKNEDAPGGLGLRQLLRTLDAERDPERPIQMILFGYGDADTKALKAIARGSGGLTYKIDRPEQIVGAFIDSIAQSVLASLE